MQSIWLLACVLMISGCAATQSGEYPALKSFSANPSQSVCDQSAPMSCQDSDDGRIVVTGSQIPSETPELYKHGLVPVYYFTDRKPGEGFVQFTGDRADVISFGRATVAIPASHHRIGQIERPKWWKFEWNTDKSRDFYLQRNEKSDQETWIKALRSQIARSGRKSVLVFVHGYNVNFDDGIFRAAQMAWDVKFPGATVLFSWASGGATLAYGADEATADISQLNFQAILPRIVTATGAQDIYIVAHSMGNRIVARGLVALRQSDPNVTLAVKEVILAAPDIDAGYFKAGIAPYLASIGKRVTMYASNSDDALKISRTIHMYPRVGDVHGPIFIAPPMETVDASGLGSDFLGHSYVSDDAKVLNDVRKIIATSASPQSRGMREVLQGDKHYWTFAK